MPSGQAAGFRAAFAALLEADREQLDLKKYPWSNTGYVGVIKVNGKFQARVQVPGDGRGGEKKRKQRSVPGIFETAEEAAVNRAMCIKALKDAGSSKLRSPPKQNKQHKPRSSKPVAAVEPPRMPLMPPQMPQMPQMPLPTAVGMPIAYPAPHAPFAAVSPLPMVPIGRM